MQHRLQVQFGVGMRGYVQYRCLSCGEWRRIAFTCKSSFCLGCAQPGTSQGADFIGRRLAVGGQQLPEIVALRGGVWDHAQSLLDRRPGYSKQQVPVLFPW